MKKYFIENGRFLTSQEVQEMPETTLQVTGTSVSDGYHTMDELYEHRIRLYLALVKIYDNYITPLRCQVVCWKSKLHDDGSEYPGWFLLGMTYTKPSFIEGTPPETWDISYHIPMKYWQLANVIALPRAPKYTGYTPNDVLERLLRL
jgi:hypothetical protein